MGRRVNLLGLLDLLGARRTSDATLLGSGGISVDIVGVRASLDSLLGRSLALGRGTLGGRSGRGAVRSITGGNETFLLLKLLDVLPVKWKWLA
jgi:hypothetical protein